MSVNSIAAIKMQVMNRALVAKVEMAFVVSVSCCLGLGTPKPSCCFTIYSEEDSKPNVSRRFS